MRASQIWMPLLAIAVAAEERCSNPRVADTPTHKSAQLISARFTWARAAATNGSLFVDTYFHVIAADLTEKGGWLPDDKLNKQFEVLNTNYASTGIQFNLKGIIRSLNETWANFDMDKKNNVNETLKYNEIELDMKKNLRKGGYDTLNIYFRPAEKNPSIGRCGYPVPNIQKDSDSFWIDGCHVLSSTIAGGLHEKYNLGATATHEVGHWFNLIHTFENGCDGGDEVDDTPAQASSSEGCPIGLDTCAGSKYPGMDPIHNFMDYSDDSCMSEFTPGQAARIHQSWDMFRVNH
ncbi:Ulilysin [Dactylellina cionopaga]|nr:Ulilysin [Dactylellina cionopaga]